MRRLTVPILASFECIALTVGLEIPLRDAYLTAINLHEGKGG